MIRRIGFLLLAFTIATSLTACGKKGAPRPPGPGSEITYPRGYPSP
jgi:hypothetical protein